MSSEAYPTPGLPSSSDIPSPSTNISRHPCLTCQRHKVKCDRRSPCTRCLTHGSDCEQPEARRPPRRPASRKSHESVVNRVRQLEDSLEEMRALLKSKSAADGNDPTTDRLGGVAEEPLDTSLGHLLIDDDKSRYISTSSWANLVGEVSGLRALLNSGDLDESPVHSTGARIVVNGLFRSSSEDSMPTVSPMGLDFLWTRYIKNVDPVMKILHIPSTQHLVTAALSGVCELNPGTNCLLAAIKFAAATSLSNEECWIFGASRSSILRTFRSEVQDALDNANFLTSHSLVTLEAFVIFLTCNRRHEEPRMMWMLCGLAIRLAESLGVHRDGTIMKLPVLVTEIRRRLWWSLRMLDVSCAEDCGFSPTHVYGADTRLPLNVNDTDISSGDINPPTERIEFTEVTWSLTRYDICSQLHGFHTHQGKESMGVLSGDKQHINQQVQKIADCRAALQSKYYRYCSYDIPIQRATLKVGKIMLDKLDLVAQYPLFQRSEASKPLPQSLRDSLSIFSCEVVEIGHNVIHDPETASWSWLLQTYIHWHPVAFLLNEICHSTQPSKYTARSWKAIKMAITGSHGLEVDENIAIWKPLEVLVEKAKTKIQYWGLDSFPNDTLTGASVAPSSMGTDFSSSSPDSGTGRQHSSLASLHHTPSPSQTQYAVSTAQEQNIVPEPNALDDAMILSQNNLMDFDLYQPYITMDEFVMGTGGAPALNFDERWWNQNSSAGF